MPSFGFSESTDIWIRPMPMSSSSLSLSSVKRNPFVVMPVVMPCPSTCFIAGMRSGWSSGTPPIRSVWSAPSSLILSTRARMSSIGTWSFELSYKLQYAQSRLHLYVMLSCAQIGRSSNARDRAPEQRQRRAEQRVGADDRLDVHSRTEDVAMELPLGRRRDIPAVH